jgi:creatinine amidohydrolase
VVRTGYETADHIADDRAGLLTLGMEHFTESGIIGRPSLAAAMKGKAAIASLVNSFADCLSMMTERE